MTALESLFVASGLSDFLLPGRKKQLCGLLAGMLSVDENGVFTGQRDDDDDDDDDDDADEGDEGELTLTNEDGADDGTQPESAATPTEELDEASSAVLSVFAEANDGGEAAQLPTASGPRQLGINYDICITDGVASLTPGLKERGARKVRCDYSSQPL